MDCLSPILNVATRFWDCTARRAVYIRELPENLDSLKSSTEELVNLRLDVLERVQREEQLQRSRRTHEVDGWLRSVQLMQAEVEEMLQNGDREIRNKCCLSGTCPKNCWYSYKLGKMVSRKIADVDDLRGKGRFDVVTHMLPPPPVDERPMGKTVGLDLMFQKVRSCLEDEKVSSIGLYGLGGVGKTTLLSKINNEYFGGRTDFDVVIWVVVSKPVDIEKIQKKILKKLGIPDQELEREGKEEMKTEIWKLLKAKKFAILLDDMWGRVDLLEVGIPLTGSQYSSKVVLTTRSERVCDDMQVDKRFRVECLTPDEAFSLFCDNVGANLLNSHPDMPRLAGVIVEECKGLPLALVVIGRSMASRKTPRDWKQATQTLKRYPSLFSGMEDQVFPILKFSYDHLDNDIIKSCFLYCSLFPEDYEISNQTLVNLWIGERFLDQFGDLDEARNQGEEIIRSLKLACLLEGDVSAERCKMHDVIRDMALWISCNLNAEEEHKVMVFDHVNLVGANETVKWQEARRISLWSSGIELSLPPCFINLQTLILREYNVKSLPVGFFQNMSVIRVLDLRYNYGLEELPSEICKLESLEYLNLSFTGIERMPVELKNLKKLRYLILDSPYENVVMPPNVISCLSNLKMLGRGIRIDRDEEVGVLQELECLQYLSELGMALRTIPGVKQLLVTSQRLQKCLTRLSVKGVGGLKEVELSPLTLQKLWWIVIEGMDDLEDVKIVDHTAGVALLNISSNLNLRNLVIVTLSKCPRILNLTWLIHAPNLEELVAAFNERMEEIIGRRVSSSNNMVFSRLKLLRLTKLPNLKSICTEALSFPSLQWMEVYECPKLRKLPLNSSCTNTTLKIQGNPKWWKELEWEDDNLKHTFSQDFISQWR